MKPEALAIANSYRVNEVSSVGISGSQEQHRTGQVNLKISDRFLAFGIFGNQDESLSECQTGSQKV
ncbi:11640_t:CDS:2 [Dentiscutata erythropus]|uniref:11640_t:CDS:1 n=1 Tax=Dentiscutata erythropus TaxID=1348616 RepID=A0A9N9A9R1_9GLOM|nr:11640_t:CDS:2 [Dentiscutata erythropus]